MKKYIYDGKPHILHEDIGYILEELHTDDHEEMMKKITSVCDQYIKYITKKEADFSIVMTRPIGDYSLTGCVGIKFKREENDSLE